jgi:hypothetical protein
MAGTIFGIPLSQRVDLNGIPSVGWNLYLYQANTSTPVNSYQDTALTVLNPWPIQADAYGMMRQFWLADGSYRARATSADGSITYFDQQAILALGASSGAAPSGGVDATAIFQTGDVIWQDKQGTRSGWVRDNGRTIGSATSGSAERANADCQPLFEFLWNNFSNTFCPVITGRGVSSLSDWTANKQITLPDHRGMYAVGLDDMGNSAAGRLTLAPIISGGVTTAGSSIGENGHITTVAEMPAHGHTATSAVVDPGHDNTVKYNGGAHTAGGIGDVTSINAAGGSSGQSLTNTTNISVNTTVNIAGSGNQHNNVPLSVPGTFFRKL